jgi:hypothetical protein
MKQRKLTSAAYRMDVVATQAKRHLKGRAQQIDHG